MDAILGSGQQHAYDGNLMAAPLQQPTDMYRSYAQALEMLAQQFKPDAWQAALDLCANCYGRVVVTGVGKSGHIGHKIAATLASTGTPAFFVHPTEANHGDLGMITGDDIIIALSNSGETAELAGVIAYAHSQEIPLIAICAHADSLLARAATHILLIPKLREICPLGLAPTTSTLLMLAVGDALAVDLMQRKELTREAYRKMHPGGQLGQRLLHVHDVMKKDALPLVAETANLHDVIVTMTAGRLGAAGVQNAVGVLIGIITDGDLRRHLEDLQAAQTATDIMTGQPKTITGDAMLEDALALMSDAKITVLFVVNAERQPIGALHLHDLVQIGLQA